MKTSLFIFAVLVLGASVFAEQKDEKKYDIYGFVRAEVFLDTYKGLNAAKDEFYLFPLYNGLSAEGDDINEQTSSNLATMASRIGIKYYGGEIFGAKTVANIEADFLGNPSEQTALLRLRQANVKFAWDKSVLTIGQTWHPLWGGSNYPTVGSLNTGAPFQPFNRSPQIRYDYNLGFVSLSGAAIYEFQYTSAGPDGKSDQYLRNAILPELYSGVELKISNITLGSGLSYKTLKPQFVTDSKFISKSLLRSVSVMGYAQYKEGNWLFKAKTVMGQNTGYLLMPGGFGVSAVEDLTGEYSYTNYNTSSSYLNIVYGKELQVGLFGGYMLNLGTTDALINFGTSDNEFKTWGMLPKIQSMYRVAPHVAYNIKNVRFVLEFEQTMAEYGTGEMNQNDGLYNNSVKPVNNRILLMFTYTF